MDTQSMEILLVEDNEDDANLTIRALKKQNLANHLVHLRNGQEALDYIFGTGSKPAMASKPRVILLDLKMPRVNGMEVLQQLKSNEYTKSIPVVILTSSAEDPDIKRCYDMGANSYIVKPVEFANFSRTVASLGMYWMVTNRPAD